MILPDSKVKPYINLVCNFIFVFMIISPLVSVFSNNMSLEDTILKKMNEYSKLYVDSYNDLANKTNNESLSKGYEDGLKAVLQLKLDEYGYELDDLKMNGSEIETIKIKEKNSNKMLIIIPLIILIVGGAIGVYLYSNTTETAIMTIKRTYNLMTRKRKKKYLKVVVS